MPLWTEVWTRKVRSLKTFCLFLGFLGLAKVSTLVNSTLMLLMLQVEASVTTVSHVIFCQYAGRAIGFFASQCFFLYFHLSSRFLTDKLLSP